METNYIVRGLDGNGGEVFYTGRAGEGWVSPSRAEAFGYSKEGAQRKALSFNRNTELHGLRFVAVAK